MGPIEQDKPWNTAGISGVHNFLKKLWRLFYQKDQWLVNDEVPSPESLKILHQVIKKINDDIERLSFNTCVSTFMIGVNELTALKCSNRAILEPLLILLSPFAPHFCEELWQQLGYTESIEFEPFPVFDPSMVQETIKEYPVSFNGKMRFTIKLSLDMGVEEIKEVIMREQRTLDQIDGANPKKNNCCPRKNHKYCFLMNYFQIEIVGLVAAVFTTVSFIPQVLKISKKRSAKGVSVSMYVIMFIGICFWLFYGILINSIAVIVANLISGILQLVIIFFSLIHRKNN